VTQTKAPRRRRVVIIGAGIAGLTTAHALLQTGTDFDIQVLEAEPRAGGTIRTLHAHGCTVDAGPEALVVTRPEAAALCKALDLEANMVAPDDTAPFHVAHDLHLVELPKGLSSGMPRLGQLARCRAVSWAGKTRAALDLVLPRSAEADGSLGALVERRLGKEVKERLVEPVFGALFAADVDRLDASIVASQLAGTRRSILGAMARSKPPPSGAVRAPSGGMQRLVDALVERVGSERIRVGTRARTLSRRADGWSIALEDESIVATDDVVVATPPHAAGSLLENAHADLAGELESMRGNSTATVILAFDERESTLPRTSGLFVGRGESPTLVSAIFASRRWPGAAPSGTLVVRALVGGARAPGYVEATEDDRIAWQTLVELRALLGLPHLRWYRVERFLNAQPNPTVGHRERMASVRNRASALGGLSFVGGSYDGGGIAGIAAAAQRLAESLSSRLS
jgi:oxygen-dependent protoporphyrinogen oxidase